MLVEMVDAKAEKPTRRVKFGMSENRNMRSKGSNSYVLREWNGSEVLIRPAE
jgi:hypothetical protein